jgi:hypothetical protein
VSNYDHGHLQLKAPPRSGPRLVRFSAIGAKGATARLTIGSVSQIDAASQVKRAGDSGELIISEWFARVARLLPASEVRA